MGSDCISSWSLLIFLLYNGGPVTALNAQVKRVCSVNRYVEGLSQSPLLSMRALFLLPDDSSLSLFFVNLRILRIFRWIVAPGYSYVFFTLPGSPQVTVSNKIGTQYLVYLIPQTTTVTSVSGRIFRTNCLFQRRAAHYVCNYYNSRTPGCVTKMLIDLRWESLEIRSRHGSLCMMYRIQHSLVDIPTLPERGIYKSATAAFGTASANFSNQASDVCKAYYYVRNCSILFAGRTCIRI